MIKIYEVMAINKGIPLFHKEHLERFFNSIQKHKSVDKQKLFNIFFNLYNEIAPIEKGFNIKLTYICYSDSFEICKLKSRKPPIETYNNGALTEMFNGERDNPLIKKENTKLQKIASEYCNKYNLYDVLLVNHFEEVTEGSRSNFLLIKNRTVITSPRGDALEGVTRKKVFEICKEQNIDIVEKKVHINDLKEADSLIITGTSPEILPVRSCGKFNYKTDSQVIRTLTNEFKIKKELDYNLNRGYFIND